MRCYNSLLTIFLLLPLYAIADPTITTGRVALQALSPAQLQQIQSVSRSILAAKNSQTPDSTQEALRQELVALHQEVSQLISPLIAANPQVNLNNAQPAASDNAQEQNLQHHFDNNQLMKVQNRLSSIHKRRTDLEAFVQQHEGEDQAENLRVLSGVTSNLEEALNEAINAPDGPDLGKLVALRDRLQSRTYAEMREEQERNAREIGETLPEPTPTITTLTRHR